MNGWRWSITGVATAVLMLAASFSALIPAHAEFALIVDPVNLVDGDTIAIKRERIRLLGIDTPETFRPRCDNELILGLKAKERLRQLLDSGPVSVERDGFDRFGRTLATVHAGDIDVGAVLLAEGHALPYRRGVEAKLVRLADVVRPGRGAAPMSDPVQPDFSPESRARLRRVWQRHQAALLQSEQSALRHPRRSGHLDASSVAERLPRLSRMGAGKRLQAGSRHQPHRQAQGLHARQLPLVESVVAQPLRQACRALRRAPFRKP